MIKEWLGKHFKGRNYRVFSSSSQKPIKNQWWKIEKEGKQMGEEEENQEGWREEQGMGDSHIGKP